MPGPITVQSSISAPVARVWELWTGPEHIPGWNFASEDWECPTATNDLRAGGTFTARMQAKDGSAGFDFEGTYTAVEENRLLEYDMSDGRHVKVEFTETPGGTQVTETFDPEGTFPVEYQQQGWQAILDNFKKYVESL